MEQYIREHLRAHFKMKKTISIIQILILIIGILAFSYMVGEIGKKSGIEISRGVGIVSAQENNPDACASNMAPYCFQEQAVTCENNFLKYTSCIGGTCEDGKCVYDWFTYEQDGKEVTVPSTYDTNENGKVDEEEKAGIMEYVSAVGGIAGTATTLYSLAEKLGILGTATSTATTATGTAAAGTGTAAFGTAATGTGGITASSTFSQLFAGAGTTTAGGTTTATLALNVVGSALAAAATAAAIYFIFKAAGAGQQNLNMIANAGLVGASVGFAASFVAILVIESATGPVGWVAAAVTAIVMGIWILFGYQNYVQEIISYQISAWQPQTGGAKCDECNKFEFGCTEYQCKTFGQGCGIVNKGTTQERCVWLNPNDRDYPVITENKTISQLPENYIYKKSTDISPPDTGVEITSTSKNCIPPFSSLTLGVTTDEPAQCRISTAREKEFDKMVKDMDEGTVQVEKHTKILPNSATANAWALNNLVNNSALPKDTEFEITKGNEYEYYIKCKDANGNENPANFVIKFCVQDKDLTAPIIKGFFVADKSFVQFNTPDVVTEVYTNEPAECKWDFQDKTYNDMSYGMTDCDTTINQATISGNSCTGNFTGLKNGGENKYYIRCQDRSEDKNTNTVSEVYTLKVSDKSVLINSITVNGKGNNSIIKDARDVIPVDLEVKTSFGAENGKAKCKYNYLNTWVDMSFDYKEINTQTLWLPEGEYTLPISCNDIAGDTDIQLISFKILKDRDVPIVARAYYDVNNLKVITNEPAECVYTIQQNIACAYNFEDGTAMSEIGELTHYTSWQANKKYFIKCKDTFGNQPLPGQCSIIVKAFESYK